MSFSPLVGSDPDPIRIPSKDNMNPYRSSRARDRPPGLGLRGCMRDFKRGMTIVGRMCPAGCGLQTPNIHCLTF